MPVGRDLVCACSLPTEREPDYYHANVLLDLDLAAHTERISM
ncbi:hypothetical protein ACFYPC_36700 [Streptomyces sp. NPDC005808]